jgi:hypothetical protein
VKKNCYRYQGVLIPGCWSRAIYGESAPCTCLRVTRKDLENRIACLEHSVKSMQEFIAALVRRLPRSAVDDALAKLHIEADQLGTEWRDVESSR